MKKLFVIQLFLSMWFLQAQVKIQGTIYDSLNQQPVAYADVSLPELKLVTTTNTDGTFYIESKTDATFLVISKYGYQDRKVTLENKINYNFQLFLQPDKEDDRWMTDDSGAIELQGAVVTQKKQRYKKKENPAYAILRKVWEKNRKNGLETVPQYDYKEYEKLQFDLSNIDSTFMKQKIFRKMEFIFERMDTSTINGKTYLPAFLNESIYRVSGTNLPSKTQRKELLGNKTSGFDNNELVAQTVKNLFREINIYDNRLNFLDINFVSPIAKDGFATYEYELRDTLDIDGELSYRIKYYPRRLGEYTFKGDIYISTEHFAVKEIVMESTKDMNVNFVRNIFLDLLLSLIHI